MKKIIETVKDLGLRVTWNGMQGIVTNMIKAGGLGTIYEIEFDGDGIKEKRMIHEQYVDIIK